MKDLYPLHEIVTVLNTPFDCGGSVDYRAVICHVREAMQAGVRKKSQIMKPWPGDYCI